jgi:hypothetical protein
MGIDRQKHDASKAALISERDIKIISHVLTTPCMETLIAAVGIVTKPQRLSSAMFGKVMDVLADQGIVDPDHCLTVIGQSVQNGLLALSDRERKALCNLGGTHRSRFVLLQALDEHTRELPGHGDMEFDRKRVLKARDEGTSSSAMVQLLDRLEKNGREQGFLKDRDGTTMIDATVVEGFYWLKIGYRECLSRSYREIVSAKSIISELPAAIGSKIVGAFLYWNALPSSSFLHDGKKVKHEATIKEIDDAHVAAIFAIANTFCTSMLGDLGENRFDFVLVSTATGDDVLASISMSLPDGESGFTVHLDGQVNAFRRIIKAFNRGPATWTLLSPDGSFLDDTSFCALLEGKNTILDTRTRAFANNLVNVMSSALAFPNLYILVKGEKKSILITRARGLFSPDILAPAARLDQLVVCVLDGPLFKREHQDLQDIKSTVDGIRAILNVHWNEIKEVVSK